MLKNINNGWTWILALACIVTSVQAQPLMEAEQMPYFSGCADFNAGSPEKRTCSNRSLVGFIAKNLVYPESARKKQIEGTVYVSFVVTAEGKVSEAKILRDIGGGCGKAALAVIDLMPLWEPAMQDGKAIDLQLTLPVGFTFKTSKQEKAATYQVNWGKLTTRQVTRKELTESLSKKIYVRDAYGNDRPITQLIFAFEKGRSYHEDSSEGEINNALKKVVKKAKKGGTFTITAVIQEEGESLYIEKAFEVVE